MSDQYNKRAGDETEPVEEPLGTKPGRSWAIAGIVSGVTALILSPIVFTPLGMVMGTVGYLRGSRRLGAIAVAISLGSLILGLILNAIFTYLVNRA